MSGSGTKEGAPGGRVLLVLLLAYIFNFIDRQIIGVLAVPIKAELGLTDTQLGLMGGIAFALFYSGLAIPIAWLADRKSRVNIIAGSVGVVERLHRRSAGWRRISGNCSWRGWASASARRAASRRPTR